jgi:hypothetical protein
VQVTARAETLGLLDRSLLRLGGRRWLAHLLRLAVDRLGERTRQPAAS